MNDGTAKLEILIHLEHVFHLRSRSGYHQNLLTNVRIQIQQIQQVSTLPALHCDEDDLGKDETNAEKDEISSLI